MWNTLTNFINKWDRKIIWIITIIEIISLTLMIILGLAGSFGGEIFFLVIIIILCVLQLSLIAIHIIADVKNKK